MKKYISIFVLSICAASLSAQVVAGTSFFDQIVSDWHMGVTADFSASAAIPVDVHHDGSGTLGVYDGTALIKFQGAKNSHAINAGVGYTRGYYDFSSDFSPFKDTNKVFANLFYSCDIDEQWSVFALGIGTIASESSADLSNGGRIVAGVGAGYKFSDTLKLGLGAGAASRMDNDWVPIPVFYIDWKITDKLSLRTFDGAALIYDVFKDGTLLINLSAQYINSDIRLCDTSYGAKRSVEDSYYQIAFGATYNFSKSMYVSASVGGNFNRQLDFRTARNSAEEIYVDCAPVFYMHFGVKF